MTGAIPKAAAGQERQDLGALSASVLRAGAALVGTKDSATLARFLYISNWAPLSPLWLRAMPDEATVERLVHDHDGVAAALKHRWTASRDVHWRYWKSRTAAGTPARYKLYLSAGPDQAIALLHAAVPVLADLGAPTFKLARPARAMLRPDRMVAYLRSEAEVRRLADALAPVVAGFSVQGVPFTSALGPSGLLSWGVDPPAAVASYATSWRRWLTKKLAAYLHASDAGRPEGRVQFALGRLGTDGVDTRAWSPRPGLWG